MAFIERKNPIVLNIKLTSKGRELLSAGKLDFKHYAIGDSEIDYDFNREIIANPNVSGYTAFDSSVLRPADKNSNQISFIPMNLSGDPYVELTNVPSTAYQVENQVESLGFFTDNNTKYITDSNHVKQPDCMINMQYANGKIFDLKKAPTYGTSGEEPAVGDILFVKWTHTEDTTGFDVDITVPRPHLFYRIVRIVGGTLAGDNLSVEVDREIPNFNPTTDLWAGAMVFYNEIAFTGDTIINMSSTDYLSESVISFLENSQCPTVVFPYWNMSIIFTEEIAGVQAGNLKYTQFKNRTLGGFVSYIQNQTPQYKKLGVIHYTNSSPANVYGEGFLQDSPTLDIPTIMWHKSSTIKLGTTLAPIGGQQLLSGLNLYYYDLADSEGFVVGKVFPDLKIFVIEDQELLFAMSYKSNRSWTLPNYDASTQTVVTVSEPITGGTNVTWVYPENNSYLAHACINYVQYCHSTQPTWTNIPAGGSIMCNNICDAGYRVSLTNSVLYGSGIDICARDYACNTNVATNGCSAGGGSTYEVELVGIDHTRGIMFCGEIV